MSVSVKKQMKEEESLRIRVECQDYRNSENIFTVLQSLIIYQGWTEVFFIEL